jgi:hypothetical protein
MNPLESIRIHYDKDEESIQTSSFNPLKRFAYTLPLPLSHQGRGALITAAGKIES